MRFAPVNPIVTVTFCVLSILSGWIGLNTPLSIAAPPAPKSCRFSDSGTCPEDELCVLPGPQCIKRAGVSAPLIRFPFAPTHSVWCIQGPVNEQGEHSTAEQIFSLDLGSPSRAGVIYAGIDGVALVYSKCPKRTDAPSCGGGFGNHVRILQQNGLMVLYAHLSEISVEDGHAIRTGERIGLEGSTGSARSRHLHLSAHFARAENWLETLSKYRETPGAVPPSIPFELQYCDPSNPKECIRKRTRVEKISCSETALLRADWRP